MSREMKNKIARLTSGAGERRESSRSSNALTKGGGDASSSFVKLGERTLICGRLISIVGVNEIERWICGPKVAIEASRTGGVEVAVGKHQEIYLSVDKKVLTIVNLYTYNEVDATIIARQGFKRTQCVP